MCDGMSAGNTQQVDGNNVSATNGTSQKKDPAMKERFEDVLEIVGDFGPWQWTLLAATLMAGISFDFHNVGYLLHSAEPDHWCRIPQLKEANWTREQIKNISIPTEVREDKMQFSRCEMYARNYSALSQLSYEEATAAVRDSSAVKVPCEAWDYDRDVYKSTTTSQWDLVCHRTVLRPTIQSVYMAGVFLGSLVFGPVADAFGRRKAIIPGVMLVMSGSILAMFSPLYPVFLIAVFINGMGTMGVFAACHVFIVELSGVQWRGLASMLFDLGPPLGGMIWAAVGYFIREWRMLYIAGIIMSGLMMLYYWILPESPRWLLVKGRIAEADIVLQNAARRNGRKAPQAQQLSAIMQSMKENEYANGTAGNQSNHHYDAESDTKCHDTSTSSGVRIVAGNKRPLWRRILVLWLTPEMRSRSLKMHTTWFCIASASYGIPFMASRLPISIYLFKFLAAFQQFIVRLMVIVPLKRYGRRWIYAGGFFFLAVSFGAFIGMPTDNPWFRASCLIFSNIFVAINFALVYLYTSELFPTEVRSVAVNVGSLYSRVGGAVAPYVVDYLGVFYSSLPGAFFSLLGFIAGTVSCVLPETKNERLFETVEEVETWRKHKKTKDEKSGSTHL